MSSDAKTTMANTRRLSEMFKHENDITADEAREKCANFLGGSWSKLTADEFTIEVLQ